VKRALVLAPSSLVHNWQAEFSKWLGRERLSAFAADSGSRVLEYLPSPGVSPVLILSYELFVRSFEDLSAEGRPRFDLLVADEGHRLKNDKIKASTMLAELDIERRVVLTGTPLQNDLKEFFALVNVVNPNALGKATENAPSATCVSLSFNLSHDKSVYASTHLIALHPRPSKPA